jgi:hypothetical protein
MRYWEKTHNFTKGTAQICCMIIPSGNDHHSVAAVETGDKQMSTGHLH